MQAFRYVPTTAGDNNAEVAGNRDDTPGGCLRCKRAFVWGRREGDTAVKKTEAFVAAHRKAECKPRWGGEIEMARPTVPRHVGGSGTRGSQRVDAHGGVGPRVGMRQYASNPTSAHAVLPRRREILGRMASGRGGR